MPYRSRRRPTYDGAQLTRDITSRGWLPIDLARKAKVSHTAVNLFLVGTRQTPRMAKRLAAALGKEPDDYLVKAKGRAA